MEDVKEKSTSNGAVWIYPYGKIDMDDFIDGSYLEKWRLKSKKEKGEIVNKYNK